MAISFSGVNAWVDETSEALNFYTDAIMGNSVVPWIAATGDLLTGVKANSIKLPSLTASVTMQDGDNCAFNDAGSVTISQATLAMKNIKFQSLLCARTMEDYFTAVTLPPGQKYTGLGQTEAAMMDRITKDIQKKLAYGYFNETTLFDGWVEQILAATGIVQGSTTITNGGATGTDAAGAYNVVQTLITTWLADEDLADEIYNGNATIVTSPAIVNLYFQNLVTLRGDNSYATMQLSSMAGGAQSFTHEGTNVQIYAQPALTGQNMVVLSRKGNFTLGFDLESDNTSLRVGLDQYEENIWYTLRTKLGVGFHALDASNLIYWGAAS